MNKACFEVRPFLQGLFQEDYLTLTKVGFLLGPFAHFLQHVSVLSAPSLPEAHGDIGSVFVPLSEVVRHEKPCVTCHVRHL